MDDLNMLMTIGDVAKSLGMTRRMIINYENRGLIVSDVRREGGYRYYTLDTLTRIRTIRILQNMGLSLDEIRDYFDDSVDLTPMLTRLEGLRDELNLNIEKLRERIKSAEEEKTRFVTIPRQTVYRRILHGAYEELPTVREKLLAAAREQNITLTGVCRHIYLEGPPQHRDPGRFITQVVLPMVDRRRG